MRLPRLGIRVTAAIALAASALGAQDTAAWAGADSAVVRLPPSAFRALPAAVRRDLARRECGIPQVYDGGAPHNVVRGAFSGSGRREWAVLCSVRGFSRILIYRAGAPTAVDSLARVRDANFLQTVGGGRIGYSRAIAVATPGRIRRAAAAWDGPAPPRPLSHDGIEDAFVGKASVIRYFHRGRWLELQGAD